MNNSELIDDLNPAAPKGRDKSVRRLVSILSVLLLVLSAFCYMDIVELLNTYAGLRGRVLLGSESLHGMVSSFFIAGIPAIAYNCRDKKAGDYTIRTYLPPLVFATILFVGFLLLGMELLFAISRSLHNSLMPHVMVVPPSAYLDLMFIFSPLLSLLILKISYRKKRVTDTNNT
ncbi:MAG: hypothetical protein ACO1N0_10035 [Fluviicola sp.]